VSPLDLLHGRLIFGRRVERISSALVQALPTDVAVLDVGCGDGSIAAEVMRRRPDLTITGVDVLVRGETYIPVMAFDGEKLPFTDRSYDVVSFVDVLHHTDDPTRLLSEAARVSRGTVVVKDHLRHGWMAEPTLRAMDWVGNARHGVRLPYNYLRLEEWREIIASAGLEVRSWDTDIALYPPPLSMIFGRQLHVLAVLGRAPAASQ
jgi:SAM-dependent methyltransferase